MTKRVAHKRRRLKLARGIGYSAVLALMMTQPLAATAEQAAQAKLGRTVETSETIPWPRNPEAPEGAPNILLIMTDDVGFGATTTFGGPVPTPSFDRLAERGLRYNQFHTAALCSPTRAALLTGRNPHNASMGNVTNLPTAYDGYTTVIPKSAGTVAEVLKQNGYNTAMFGKGHITPEWEQSQAGPFDRWPTGLGFEYFYGFLSADASMWAPPLIENTRPLEPPHDDPDYHFDADMADRAIAWLNDQHAAAPDKPFFVYYAPGTAHTPHHAPKEWLDKFRGKFDQGWDKMREETFARQKELGIIPADAALAERPRGLPAWDSLNADQKRLYARLMEAYAAALAYLDAQIGRVIDSIEEKGELDNTLVIFLQGDNGGSAEGGLNGLLYEQSSITGARETFDYMLSRIDDIGGPLLYNHFPAAWGWAINTPFPLYKQVASHLGGTRNGLVISWPERIRSKGEVRPQFHYVTDIPATILEVAGLEMPEKLNGVEQMPLDGISMTYSFTDGEVESARTMQVFEMMENFAIYKDGWLAGSTPKRLAWEVAWDMRLDNLSQEAALEQRNWELYNLREDFSQTRDLAEQYPEKLKELQELFWKEAERNQILPIHDFSQGTEGRPSLTDGRDVFTYTSRVTRIPEAAAPPTIGRSFTIEADLVIPDGGANGVLVTHGGRFGGYGLYLHKGVPVFHYNAVGEYQHQIRGERAVPKGEHKIVAEFVIDERKPGAGGLLTLTLDGKRIGRGNIPRTINGWMSHTDGFDVGQDTITPVSEDYTIPESRFSGDLRKLTIRLD